MSVCISALLCLCVTFFLEAGKGILYSRVSVFAILDLSDLVGLLEPRLEEVHERRRADVYRVDEARACPAHVDVLPALPAEMFYLVRC